MICTACGQSLRRAVYQTEHGLKSCPHCSARAGRHVFYAPARFGERRPHGGRAIAQSWCRGCRSDAIAGVADAHCGALSVLPVRAAASHDRRSTFRAFDESLYEGRRDAGSGR